MDQIYNFYWKMTVPKIFFKKLSVLGIKMKGKKRQETQKHLS